MKKLLVVGLLCSVSSWALGQQIIPPNGYASFPPNTSLNLGTGTLTATNGLFTGQLQDVQTINTATYTGSARQIINQTYLTPTATNAFIWENDDSFLEQSGTGTEQGETNLFHGYFQLDAGATAWQMENFEASTYIIGTVGGGPGIISFLSQPDLASTGTVNSVSGLVLNLTNANTTAGAIGQYNGIVMTEMTGGGSLPTNYFAILNYDSHAGIATVGGVSIGSVNYTNDNAGELYIQGPDTASGTYPFFVKNSALNILFGINDSGGILINNGAGGIAGGVSCTGTPTSSFASLQGIVTHC